MTSRPLVVDRRPHPITTAGRDVRTVVVPPEGLTLAALAAREWPGPGPVAAWRNGERIPEPEWERARAGPGDVVTLRAAVAGGGDDTDPLRTVLTIAVVAAAVYVGGGYGAFGAWPAWGKAALAAGIAVGGRFIVDAIARPLLPGASDLPGDAAASTPPAALTNIRNRTRPYGPVPLVLGTHLLYPDAASTQYATYDGDDQYVNAVFGFGAGNLYIPAAGAGVLRIGDTALSSYQGVATQWSDARGRLNLIEGDSSTQEGSSFPNTAWIVRDLPVGATKVVFEFIVRAFAVNPTTGAFTNYSSSIYIQRVAIPAAGDPRVIHTEYTWTHADPTPHRHTVTLDLPTDGVQPADGRGWRIHCRLVTQQGSTAILTRQVAWESLRVISPDLGHYDGQTRLALRLKASGQLSGAVDRLSAVVSQRVPTWDAAIRAWTVPRASSNPAWIFRWFAAGIRDSAGRLIAGAGLPAARIDDASLQAWGAWCDAQRLECNHVLQGSAGVADVLALIARCGYASPTWSAGKLGVVWEAANQTPVASITPANVLAGSVSVDYAAGPVVDEVVATFADAAEGWESRAVRRRAAGVTVPKHSVEIPLPGVTNVRQAAQAANLALARQTLQRRRVTWTMGPEALQILHRGDVVRFSSPLLDGGLTGRASRLAGVVLGLGREVDLPAGANHLLVALPDGRLHTARVLTAAGRRSELTLDSAVPAPEPGAPPWEPDDLRWRLYADDEPPARLRITEVAPQIGRDVRLTGADDDSRYYAAATADQTADALAPTGEGGAPEVLAVFAWSDSLGGGVVAGRLVHVTIRVRGAWEGGEVWSSGGGGGPVARIERQERGASWTATSDEDITITVIPDGHPGGALTITFGATNLRPPSVWMRGAWRAGVSYLVNDVVQDAAGLWICTLAHTSSSRSRPSGSGGSGWWDTWVQRGVDGKDGAGTEWRYTLTNAAAIPANQRPSDTWGFDIASAFRGGREWTDGLRAPTASLQYAWVSRRSVPGTPAQGTTPPRSGSWPRSGWGRWTAPVIIARYAAPGRAGATGPRGIPGADGADGNGVEWIFASSASANLSASQRPNDLVGFDTAHTRGGVRWVDALPGGLSAASPLRWASSRSVPGTPAQGATPPRSGSWPRSGWGRWTAPVIIARYAAPGRAGATGPRGIPGADGADGNGVEWIFALHNRRTTTTSQRPNDLIGFDTAHTRGGVAWVDAWPVGQSQALPYVLVSRRAVPGTPAQGATPPRSGSWPRSGWGRWSVPAVVSSLVVEDSGVGWQQIGNILICTGEITNVSPGGTGRFSHAWSFTWPEAFAAPPTVIGLSVTPTTVTATGITGSSSVSFRDQVAAIGRAA